MQEKGEEDEKNHHPKQGKTIEMPSPREKRLISAQKIEPRPDRIEEGKAGNHKDHTIEHNEKRTSKQRSYDNRLNFREDLRCNIGKGMARGFNKESKNILRSIKKYSYNSCGQQ